MQERDRVVVVGSGPAGATAAFFLTHAGVDVTLVEAGSERSAFGLTARVGGVTFAKVRRPLGSRKVGVQTTASPVELYEDLSPGGLSNHWSCAVPRFSPNDFRDAERFGESCRWPITYEELAPWYDRVEPLLHIAGTSDDFPELPAGRVRRVWHLEEAWTKVGPSARAIGRDVVPLPYAYGSDTTLTFSGTVFNAFVRLVKPALKTGRLRILYDTRAVGVQYSSAAKRASGVTVRNAQTGVIEQLPCKAVVLAAGAVNTASLLFASKCEEFPDGLGNTHGVLGKYLHDHPLGKVMIDLDDPISVFPPAYLTRRALAQADPLYAAACVQWTGAGMLLKSVVRRTPGRLRSIGFNVFGTMAPSPENFVAPDASSTGPDGAPGLIVNLTHPPGSEKVLEEARDQLVGLLQAAGARPRVTLWKVEMPGTSVHLAGTCRMHESPRHGMLDKWSRLHAVPNVIVADSAAFTTGPEKNPVLTAMALSARASGRLVEELRAGVA